MNNAYTINFEGTEVAAFVAVGSVRLDARVNVAAELFLLVRQCMQVS